MGHGFKEVESWETGCRSCWDPLAVYAVFNEVLPHWHPVSQPEECKAGEKQD